MKKAYIETISLSQELYRVVIEYNGIVIFSQVIKGWWQATDLKQRIA